jgi:CPA2 family monovalent cation:H+ antiporter-2
MHELLRESVTILAAAIAVLLLSNRLRIPSVVGFLLTGVLIGPSGLRLVSDTERVEMFAEIGVVFLLFSIGLEFSLERLKQIRRFFFLGGSLQALLTIALITLLFLPVGSTLNRAVFQGFLVTLSSTAIVLKLYADRRELDAPQGKILIGILLFQDFLIVPMIVLTPVLAGKVTASAASILLRFGGALALVALVFAVARYLMPRLLRLMVRTRIREVLVLGALALCLGMALLTEALEFSLALGAFIAGIIISESEYSHQVVAEVTPFRDVFNSLFFISIGMLLELPFALTHPVPVLTLAGAILGAKALAGGAAAAVLGFPRRIVAIVALALAQVGEFSFVLLQVGQSQGLLDRALYQTFIAASILTMIATPSLVGAAPRLGEALGHWGRRPAAAVHPAGETRALRRHVVIVGFGVNGRNLARVLRAAHISYKIVELNGEMVRRGMAEKEPILFGDATRREILEHVGIAEADVVVFAISDLEAVRRAIRLARELNPKVRIIVRTRLVDEIEGLHQSGADEVIAEEFETSIEIFTRVLEHYHIPRNIIRAETRALRGQGYQMMRSPSTARLPENFLDLLAAGTTEVFQLEDESPAVGQTIHTLDLRRRTGVTVIALVRGERSHPNPHPDLQLEAGDRLVLMGNHAEMEQAFDLLEPPLKSPEPQALVEIP